MISDISERESTEISSGDVHSPSALLLVRVDQKEPMPSVLPHSLAVASGLGRRIKLIEVIDTSTFSDTPVDPVDWDIKKREAQMHLEQLAETYGSVRVPIEIQVLEHVLPGDIADSDRPPILAFGRRGSDLPWHLDETNRYLVEHHCGSILMVPDEPKPQKYAKYSRIVVPLDGSSRAEAALPVAIALARKHKAQLYLVNVTPTPSLTLNGPLNNEDKELENRLSLRNDRVAHEYLKTIRGKCNASGVKVNIHVLNEGDARRGLLDIAQRKKADLIIMNSHGSGGYCDVFSGSVATFVLEHATLPVLMIGQRPPSIQNQLFSELTTSDLRKTGFSQSAV